MDNDLLDICYAELQRMDSSTPLPTPVESQTGGLAAGAAPLAFLVLMFVLGFLGTGGDLLCDASSTSRACVELAARQAAS
jgi:hypothetical protein|mmetsp:Transcript_3222/g.6983  ORF Transcript_3222/g.6983 Transcript_3222/m.6983 type:complete len:80 (-) Transcript_3222:301-540(-)